MNIKNIFAASLLAVSVVSCDLDTVPTTSLTPEAVYKTTDNLEAVLKGSWNNIFTEGWTYASIGYGSIQLNDDFAGSDIVRPRSYGFFDSYNLTNGYSRGEYNTVLWDLMYKAINDCNAIIMNVDDSYGDDNQKAIVKGQAYATRGFCYTVLASHYSFAIDKDPNAICVPIYLEPTKDLNQALTGKEASSVSEVYTQAMNDLQTAVNTIPETYKNTSDKTQRYKITKTIAQGLLARAALYSRNWQIAYDNAVSVLQANDYLMSEEEYKSGFNDCSNSEWLWGLASSLDFDMSSYLFEFKDTYNGWYKSALVDPNFRNKFSDDDYRKDNFVWYYVPKTNEDDRDPAPPVMRNKKFIFADKNNRLADIVLMRTSEIYLIKAEAAAQLGNNAEAQTTLTSLRQARMKDGKTAPVVATTGNDLIKEIWMERRKELWGEGFALTDIIRNQQALDRATFKGNIVINGITLEAEGHTKVKFSDGTDFVPNSKYYLFRFPESEELHNPKLYSKCPKLSIYDL